MFPPPIQNQIEGIFLITCEKWNIFEERKWPILATETDPRGRFFPTDFEKFERLKPLESFDTVSNGN